MRRVWRMSFWRIRRKIRNYKCVMQNDIVKTGESPSFLFASNLFVRCLRLQRKCLPDAGLFIPYFSFIILHLISLSSFFGIVHSTNPPYLCISLKGYLSVIICFSFAFHKLSVIDNLMGRQKCGKGKSNGCNESENLKKSIKLFIL